MLDLLAQVSMSDLVSSLPVPLQLLTLWGLYGQQTRLTKLESTFAEFRRHCPPSCEAADGDWSE